MTLVIDASFVVAAFLDAGPVGRWAERLLRSDELAAPQHMLAEVDNVFRRAALTRQLAEDAASLLHEEMVALPVGLHPYQPLASRIWELRRNVVPYDAWYVALAETIDARLATLDRRLAAAPGPRCTFVLPPE